MAHAERRLVWIVAVALLSSGSGLALAADGPAPDNDEVKFSPGVGADRPLMRDWGRSHRVKIARDGRRIVIVAAWAARSHYAILDAETGEELLHVQKNASDHHQKASDQHQTATDHLMVTGDIDEVGRWAVTGGAFNLGYQPGFMRSQPTFLGGLADVWDARSGRLVRTFVQDDRRHGAWAAISRNGARVVCVDYLLNAKIWDRETGREIAAVQGALPPGSKIDGHGFVSDDLKRFAVFAWRKEDYRDSIYLCDIPSKRIRQIGPPKEEKAWYRKLAIRGDGREVAAYRVDEHMRELVLLDFDTGAVRSRFQQPIAERTSFMSYGPDGSTVVLGFVDGHLNLVNLQNGARVELRASDGPVNAAAYLPDRGLVRVVVERRVIWNADHSEAHYAGPMRIADFAVRFPSPSP